MSVESWLDMRCISLDTPLNSGKTLDERGNTVDCRVDLHDSDVVCGYDKRNTEEAYNDYVAPYMYRDKLYSQANRCGCKNPNCPNGFVKENSTASAGNDAKSKPHTSGVELIPASAILVTLVNCRLKELGLCTEVAAYHHNKDFSEIFRESVMFVAKLCAASNAGEIHEFSLICKGRVVKINFEDIVACHSHDCAKYALGKLMRSAGVDESCICDETLAISGGLTEDERCKHLSDNRLFWSYWQKGKHDAERRRVYDWLVDIHVHSLYHSHKIRSTVMEIQVFVGYIQAFPKCPEFLIKGVSDSEYASHADAMMYNACLLFVRDFGFNLNVANPWSDKVLKSDGKPSRKFSGFKENFATLKNEISSYLGHTANDAYVLMVYLYWSNLNLNNTTGYMPQPYHPVTGYPQLTTFGDTTDFFCPRLMLAHLRQGLESGGKGTSIGSKQVADLANRQNYAFTSDDASSSSRVPGKKYRELRDAVRKCHHARCAKLNPEIPGRAIKFITIGNAKAHSDSEERTDHQCRLAVLTMARILMNEVYNESSMLPEPGRPPEDWQIPRRTLWTRAYRMAFMTIKSPKAMIMPPHDFDFKPQLYGQCGFWPTATKQSQIGKPIDQDDIVKGPIPIPEFVRINRTRAKAEAMRLETPLTPLGGRKRFLDELNRSICNAVAAQYEEDPHPHEALGLGTHVPIESITDAPMVQEEMQRVVREALITQKVDFEALRKRWYNFPQPNAAIVTVHGNRDDEKLLSDVSHAVSVLDHLVSFEFPGDSNRNEHVLLSNCMAIMMAAFERMDTVWRVMHNDSVDPWFNPPSAFKEIIFSYDRAEHKVKHPLEHVHKPLLQIMRMAKAPRTDAVAMDPSSPFSIHLDQASKARAAHQITRKIVERSQPPGEGQRKHSSLLLEVIRATAKPSSHIKLHQKVKNGQQKMGSEDEDEDDTASIDNNDDYDDVPWESSAGQYNYKNNLLTDGETLVFTRMQEQLPELIKQHTDAEFSRLQCSGLYGDSDRKKFEKDYVKHLNAFFSFSDLSAPRMSDFMQLEKTHNVGDTTLSLHETPAIIDKLFKQIVKRAVKFKPSENQLDQVHHPPDSLRQAQPAKKATRPDASLLATAINLDGALNSQDVAHSVKDKLGIEMSLDAAEERLEDDVNMFESGAVADTMAYELTHVPPYIAYGVPPELAVPMHRNPGRLLPSALGY